MIFKDVFERFVAKSPLSVMVRATLENVFAPSKLDQLFERTAVTQYTRELLFSTTIDLMSLVVTRVHPSMRQAYLANQERVGVSAKALYDKLNHVEMGVSQEVVRHTARESEALIRRFQGTRTPLLPKYRCRILDGNHLAATEHRLKVLRNTKAGPLPGQSLVLLDPETMLIVDVFPCADGHAQERSFLPEVLPSICEDDVMIADRNFCTTQFLFNIHRKGAFFLIRQHAQNLFWRTVGERRFMGRTKTGSVYEQTVILTDPETNAELRSRRVTIKLKTATRDGDLEIHLLTNLPKRDATAVVVADLYLKRWTLETAFQEVTTHLKCELHTLGYPQAALFAFCVALAMYNVLAVIKGAICAVHGEDTLKDDVSNYGICEEISGVYQGMMIAIPPSEWELFQTMTVAKLSQVLVQLTKRISLTKFQKSSRGPKKPQPPRKSARGQHVSTAKLIAAERIKAKPPPP